MSNDLHNDIPDLACAVREVRERIRQAARRAGRNEKEITLVAVSKSVGQDKVAQAIACGVRHFGENRVQEFVPKQAVFPQVNWHFIGHLQTNKVKDIIGKAYLIHSLDRWRLAEYIDDRARGLEVRVPVLLQVNVSGEKSKYGLAPAEVMSFLEAAQDLGHLSIQGLMTMAPEVDDPEETRTVFKDLHRIFESIKQKNFSNTKMQYLSMGMTQDFEVAIEEGANLVRVGRAIFGSRR